MTKLKNYLQDGANYQARAVLMHLQGIIDEDNDITVARWENCREQGYVCSVRSSDYKRQLNIAWFEHRNGDSICAVKWEQCSLNSLNISNAVFGDVYKDKFDVSNSIGYEQYAEMAEWINEQLVEFISSTRKK